MEIDMASNDNKQHSGPAAPAVPVIAYTRTRWSFAGCDGIEGGMRLVRRQQGEPERAGTGGLAVIYTATVQSCSADELRDVAEPLAAPGGP
jgi:hypothetical protein